MAGRAEGRRHDPKAQRADGKFDAGRRGMHFAVGVEGAGGGSLDGETCGAEVVDGAVAKETLPKEAPEERRAIEEGDGRNGGEVEQAVVDAGSGGDVGVVAVLVGIRDRQSEGAEDGAVAVVLDGVDLRSVTKIGGGAGGEIAGKTAAGETIELGGDLGFETEAGGGEERAGRRPARCR
jgi:hypothetical protein